MQDNTQLDIVTDLTLDEVKRRLREVILEDGERQTQYHQKFVGHINDKEVSFKGILTGRSPTVYHLTFGTINGQTLISLSNNVYDGMMIESAMIKCMMIPVGFIILILGCVFYSSWQELLIAIVISAIIITLSILYKVKPLSREEYLKDPSVRTIMKTINGQVL